MGDLIFKNQQYPDWGSGYVQKQNNTQKQHTHAHIRTHYRYIARRADGKAPTKEVCVCVRVCVSVLFVCVCVVGM